MKKTFVTVVAAEVWHLLLKTIFNNKIADFMGNCI